MSGPSSRPYRVLRVGVTGARALDPKEMPRLREQARLVLREIARLAVAHGVRDLELHSPLAEGADRLVAESALEVDFSLVCPLPFALPEYEKDFSQPGSLAAFRTLLARAEGRVVMLDGGRGDDEARSYEAVGQLVVRCCDLIIAIWNGRPGQGRGGTADTVRYAASLATPVIWLHAAQPDVPARWIENLRDLDESAMPRAVAPLLDLYLARRLHSSEPTSG